MRSVSHLIAGEIAKVKGEQWTKNFFDKIIYRPDDMMEIMAYYFSTCSKRPVPASLKKGFAKAFDKFDEYTLAKYRGESNDISLVDLVNLVHPKPIETNKEALAKLVKGTLKSKDTWESELTKAGQDANNETEKEELKKEAWIDLVKNKKIKYFALLRNLRNIIQQAPEVLPEALEMLTDEKLITKSLVLPFRYLTAIQQIAPGQYDRYAINTLDTDNKLVRSTVTALNKAVDIATKSVPEFPGETLVALDCSGSMGGMPIEIGSLFAAVLAKKNNADIILFSDDAKYINVNTADSTMSIVKQIREKCSMAGTNFPPIFRTANKKYDRIFILSDMQGWMEEGAPTSAFSTYKTKFSASPFVYSINLNDYGTIMFPERNVFLLAGWSEKIFDIIKLLETDKDAMLSEIEKIVL
jgi:hypothetical protein